MKQAMAEDPARFEQRLGAMTDDELFSLMKQFEDESEKLARKDRTDELMGHIMLIEAEINRRYPGQALLPYKQWQRDNIL